METIKKEVLEKMSYKFGFGIDEDSIVWNLHYIDGEEIISLDDEYRIGIIKDIIETKENIVSFTTLNNFNYGEDGDFFGTIYKAQQGFLVKTSGYEFTNYSKATTKAEALEILLKEAEDYYASFETKSEDMEEVIECIKKARGGIV